MTENSTNYIYGKNAVLEAVMKNPKRINKIYIAQNIGLDNRLKQIKELAYQNSIVVQFANLHNKKFPKDVPTQNVIADIAPVEYMALEDFTEKMKEKEGFKKVVILDGVQDPHNFGAIIRTCACAGYDGIIVASHRACPLNATVEKTSSGALNHVHIIKVSSLPATIDFLKNNSFWIIATDSRCEDNYFDIDYTDMNFAFILGAEGDGITKTLMNKADFKIKIPTNFESLNVSSTCAVIVYEALRQILTKSKI